MDDATSLVLNSHVFVTPDFDDNMVRMFLADIDLCSLSVLHLHNFIIKKIYGEHIRPNVVRQLLVNEQNRNKTFTLHGLSRQLIQ